MPKKILIVEDEKPMAKALELKLTREGFEAKAVFDGEKALKILESETFDLILLDLVMPNLNGFGVLTELKARNIKTPVIVTTNLSQEEDEKKAKELGATDYLVKSDTSIIEVVNFVKKTLGTT